MLTIEDGKVVSIHYTLTDDQGEEIDRSTPDDPLYYLHGVGQIVPGLERELQGLSVGDTCNAVISPADGYGEFVPQLNLEISRDSFPDDAELEEGMQFVADLGDGQPHLFWVIEVRDDVVEVDANHPLAGVTLHFDVEIAGIRDATPEEIDHGHVHGHGGHHH